MAKKRKVLLVGWDAADWKVIDNLMANGLMPAMKRVVDNGVRGRLATLDPPLSPMLWTSIATGVRPYSHGILGFVEHDGAGGIRPISSHGRKVDAFWNMFTKEGLKSNVVGWWPSNPVENINGVMVSNLFQQEKKGLETIALDDWKIPAGTIYPESYTERLAELRIHPSEITGNLVMPFVPRALEMDKKEDKRLTIIAKFLAHSASLHAVTTELMETEEWDITAVYHDALDHFSHGFMKYHPPKMDGLEEEMYDVFKDVVTGAYVYHDMMLDRLLNMIDDDTTVVICSDHGFHSDHLRPRFVPQVPSGPAVEHSPYGVFAAMGPGIKKGENIHGARVLDVTPTLLTLFDLPIGRDMDGKPLMDIYDHPKKVKYIDSWENDERFGGELVVTDTPDESTNEAALQQLIDLGYIDDLKILEGEDAEDAMKGKLRETMRENNFYLAKSYTNGQKYEEALEILLEIENKEKPDYRFLIEIVGAATKTSRYALAEEYIKYIRVNKLMSEHYLDVLEAQTLIGLGKPAEALTLLEKAIEEFPDSTQVLLDLAKLLNFLGQTDKAIKIFKRILEIDPRNSYAYHGIGLAALRTEDYETALENLLAAVEGTFHYPIAHIHIGETLALMKQYEAARSSFEIVEAISPELPKVYRWLLDLNEIIGDEKAAAHYRRLVGKFDRGTKVILTGLPGANLVNTLNYLKETKGSVFGSDDDLFGESIGLMSTTWIDEIDEHIVYVPLNLLGSLPTKYSYRIVYVNDDIENVVEYLNKLDRIREATFNKGLIDGVEQQEDRARIWISQQPALDVLYVRDEQELDSELMNSYLRKS